MKGRRGLQLAAPLLLAVAAAGCGGDGTAASVTTTAVVEAATSTTATTSTASTTTTTTGTVPGDVGIDVAELERLVTGAEALADELDADLAGDGSEG